MSFIGAANHIKKLISFVPYLNTLKEYVLKDLAHFSLYPGDEIQDANSLENITWRTSDFNHFWSWLVFREF